MSGAQIYVRVQMRQNQLARAEQARVDARVTRAGEVQAIATAEVARSGIDMDDAMRDAQVRVACAALPSAVGERIAADFSRALANGDIGRTDELVRQVEASADTIVFNQEVRDAVAEGVGGSLSEGQSAVLRDATAAQSRSIVFGPRRADALEVRVEQVQGDVISIAFDVEDTSLIPADASTDRCQREELVVERVLEEITAKGFDVIDVERDDGRPVGISGKLAREKDKKEENTKSQANGGNS